MADPVWSASYDLAQTPEANGFTRIVNGNATVNLVMSGNPNNRMVELITRGPGGEAIFVTSNVPALDRLRGVTAECVVSVNQGEVVSDPGPNFGIEVTFLDYVFAMQVFPDKVWIFVPAGENQIVEVLGDHRTLRRYRVTYDGAVIRLYRDAALIAGPYAPAPVAQPWQRVLWWAELGADVVLKELKSYLGGAVAP